MKKNSGKILNKFTSMVNNKDQSHYQKNQTVDF